MVFYCGKLCLDSLKTKFLAVEYHLQRSETGFFCVEKIEKLSFHKDNIEFAPGQWRCSKCMLVCNSDKNDSVHLLAKQHEWHVDEN